MVAFEELFSYLDDVVEDEDDADDADEVPDGEDGAEQAEGGWRRSLVIAVDI